VVPVISGGFGGKAPTLNYPPRPFLPAAPADTDASQSGTCSPVPKKNAPLASSADEEEEQAGDSSRERQRSAEAGGTQAGEGSTVQGSTVQGSALGLTGASVLLVVLAALLLVLLGATLLRRSRSIRYE
ncbi:MAG: hypothetical protein LC799_33035, partial [Actinobacteria bacterium]|nr:hypothetical protein [Actinomycetota bacterium]